MRSKGKADDIRAEGKPALVPKLRFPEFREARGWEVKAVGDVFRTTRGHVLPMSSVKDEPSPSIPYPVYSSQTKNGGLAGYFSSYLFEDAITWTTDGANAGDVNFRSGRFYCTNVCGVLVNLQGYANACVAALLNSVTRTHVSYVGNPKLMNGVMERIEIPFPQLAEQHLIADFLSSADAAIAAQARKVDALKKQKKGLMQDLFPRKGETQPRRRFPEFQNAGEWQEGTVAEFIITITPSKKLQTSDYRSEGKFPIVDQSQDYICGWTNDGEAIVENGLPVIVFGDHTCVLKFVDRPFVQGADGIKIITAKSGINTRFLFYALESNPVIQESYKRHFSVLKEKIISFPDSKSGEQKRITECLTSIDDLIVAQTQKLHALKRQKRGLMQQLFPSQAEAEG
ncbi:MAG: restriction endonuclease subunit S [Burkholderiales bacterium]|nr:restriction endonuclease subunit S [Burkholderiales bacterium]MCA3288645.1 restriction endonuclease subunit S [Roseomonas sp.]MCA3291147.1 restriction endonuclease subunit S [Roseomonas sp.]